MAKGISGRRHAQAVFQIALEEKQLDRWLADVERIAAVLGDAEIAAVSSNPKESAREEERRFGPWPEGSITDGHEPGPMLVARNRLHLVQSLAVEYKRLMNAYGGVELAEVTTAVPISTEEGESVGKGLAALSGKRVTLELGVDPEILGGFVARLGDKLIDASARTRLQELRKSIA
jgi:F-type H+-transporting ATPase subunit delta